MGLYEIKVWEINTINELCKYTVEANSEEDAYDEYLEGNYDDCEILQGEYVSGPEDRQLESIKKL